MNKLIQKISVAVAVVSLSFSAWAISLEDAKEQSLVGEMANGYLGVIVNNKETAALVENINNKRKEIYINLARKNDLTMQQVTSLAGKKAIEKTQSGHMVQTPEGQWVKK